MPAALRVSGCGPHAQRREHQKLRIEPSAADHPSIQIAHAFDFRSPAAATSTRKPRRGGGHGWPPFSDRGTMPSPKITMAYAWLERFVEESAFFGYFLCTSKESNSPSGESSTPTGRTVDQTHIAGSSSGQCRAQA